MSKKILCLLLAFSLVVGLMIPAAKKPQAEALAENYVLKIDGVTYTLKDYDTRRTHRGNKMTYHLYIVVKMELRCRIITELLAKLL